MIRGMKKGRKREWSVYILCCGDGSLYTGIAKDVEARLKQHNNGKGATYTRTRLPVNLLFQQEGLTHSKALIQEAQIKAMPRSKKEEIILTKQCVKPFIPANVSSTGEQDSRTFRQPVKSCHRKKPSSPKNVVETK